MRYAPDELVSLPVAGDLFPVSRSPNTVRVYCRNGVRLADGKFIKLKCQRIGGRFYTCQRWIYEFLAELNGGTLQLTEAEQERRHSAVEEELQKLGC